MRGSMRPPAEGLFCRVPREDWGPGALARLLPDGRVCDVSPLYGGIWKLRLNQDIHVQWSYDEF